MNLEEIYKKERIGDLVEPTEPAPDFADAQSCGDWLAKRLVDTLRAYGLEGEVRTQVLVATCDPEATELDGGGREVPLRGVVTVEQDCHSQEHSGIVVPFSIEARLHEKDGNWVLQVASLGTEDEDVAFLQ